MRDKDLTNAELIFEVSVTRQRAEGISKQIGATLEKRNRESAIDVFLTYCANCLTCCAQRWRANRTKESTHEKYSEKTQLYGPWWFANTYRLSLRKYR